MLGSLRDGEGGSCTSSDGEDGESDNDNETATKPVISMDTAWAHTNDLRDFALNSQNAALLDYITQAQQCLQEQKRKTKLKQATIVSFFNKQ